MRMVRSDVYFWKIILAEGELRRILQSGERWTTVVDMNLREEDGYKICFEYQGFAKERNGVAS